MSESPRLDWKDIRNNAAKFSVRYKNAKKEASLKQPFWTEFLGMFGVDAIQIGAFEYYVKKLGDKTGEIDYFWPGKVIIEHKSAGKDLDAAVDQAMDYFLGINEKEKRPRYIIVSDFQRIRLLDLLEKKDNTIKLSELPNNIELFGFLAGYSDKKIEGQHPVNVKAAEVMGKLYDRLKESKYPAEDLDLLLVRLVFCLFAEDADIFDKHSFTAYLSFNTREDGCGVGSAINEIFAVLDTKYEDRQTTMSSELQNFPYVNGGLFSKHIADPMFDRGMREILLGAAALDWRYISPAIFGSLFQSIMDPKMRRELGAHYTSEENILKLINPLFMDDLRREFDSIKGNQRELRKFWDKISEIRILDPACGCGNFLIISYREMRKLEMDVLSVLYKNQMILDESHLHIDHYYGIEIGEFPSMVAKLSMILMDHLMNIEMRNRFGCSRDILPLKEKANIVCGDSLELDWNSIVDSVNLTYIVGNPPFVGAKVQSLEQRNQMMKFFQKNSGIMDYVSAWYVKASNMMELNPIIRTAFVSTNSITQGEQVEPLWGMLFKKGITIDFAYSTFRWNNEAKGIAAVHVVIIGFSYQNVTCKLYTHSDNSNDIMCTTPKTINAYLVDGPNVFITNRSKPICDVPKIEIGSQPIDNGNYLFTKEEMEEFIKTEPKSTDYFRPWLGSREFINGEYRYCLWLGNCSPQVLKSMPKCMERVEAVRKYRLSSKRKQTLMAAKNPTHFYSENVSDEPYIIIPKVSSERRHYIPIGFMQPSTMCSDLVFMIPGATLYHFGVLTSTMHMTWMRYVCGRLKSDYRYSGGIVYNNFPWPESTEKNIQDIENAAKLILEIREKYVGASLADLYDPLTMPEDLLAAHKKLDEKVDESYNFKQFTDEDRMKFMLEKYLEIVNE